MATIHKHQIITTYTLLPNSTTQRQRGLDDLKLKCGLRLLIYKVILADLYQIKGTDESGVGSHNSCLKQAAAVSQGTGGV